MKTITTNIGGYMTTTRTDGSSHKVGFILPEEAKKMTNKQIQEITSDAPESPQIDSREKLIEQLKAALKKHTHGFTAQAKREFLVNQCDAESWESLTQMSEWGIKCLIEKLEENNG